MKTLFERVFNGSDQMFAKAEEEVNKIAAEVGRDAPLAMPSTAYCLACIYAYIGKKVITTGELQDALADLPVLWRQSLGRNTRGLSNRPRFCTT